MSTMRITFLAYPGCMAMEIFGLCDTLLLANRIAQTMAAGSPPLFEVTLASLKGAPVLAAGGFSIGTLKTGRNMDLLVVPGMDFSDRQATLSPFPGLAREVAYIERIFAKGITVASVCVGAFLLGDAGLLDGRRATTSWLFAADLARRFPTAKVEPTALLVEDGGVLTSGSFSATFDLAMHLIRLVASPDVARAVGRIALLDQRESQAGFVDTRMLDQPPASFAQAIHTWLAQRLSDPYDLQRLASAFHISGRTLLRRIKEETGESPLSYLQRARIDQAKVLLESTSFSVAQVTERVGYQDVGTFSGLFKRLVKQSPAEYRRRFRGQQRPGVGADGKVTHPAD